MKQQILQIQKTASSNSFLTFITCCTGEWYYDREKSQVSYWPMAGEDDPNSLEIIAPQVLVKLTNSCSFAEMKTNLSDFISLMT